MLAVVSPTVQRNVGTLGEPFPSLFSWCLDLKLHSFSLMSPEQFLSAGPLENFLKIVRYMHWHANMQGIMSEQWRTPRKHPWIPQTLDQECVLLLKYLVSVRMPGWGGCVCVWKRKGKVCGNCEVSIEKLQERINLFKCPESFTLRPVFPVCLSWEQIWRGKEQALSVAMWE